MPGGKTAGQKLRQTMINKFGSEEAWKAWMRENGRKGGSTTPLTPRGFAAMTPDRHSAASRKGGKKSKRGKAHDASKET